MEDGTKGARGFAVPVDNGNAVIVQAEGGGKFYKFVCDADTGCSWITLSIRLRNVVHDPAMISLPEGFKW